MTAWGAALPLFMTGRSKLPGWEAVGLNESLQLQENTILNGMLKGCRKEFILCGCHTSYIDTSIYFVAGNGQCLHNGDM